MVSLYEDGIQYMKKKILIIDDEQMNLNVLKLILEEMGYEITTYSNPFQGEEAALQSEFDLIVVDLRMPGRNGAEITEAVMVKRPQVKVLILTGFPNDPLAQRALDAGALSLLKKPFEIAKILDFIEEQS